MGGKLLNRIMSMYVNKVACVKVKEGESECFRIDIGVRKGCIMSPWLFNVYWGLPQLYEALVGWKSVCGQAHNLRT